MPTYIPFNRPQSGAPRWNPVAAVEAGQQHQMAQQAEELSLQSMLTNNQQQVANLQRYQGQTPNELDKSNLEGLVARESMGIPGYGRQMGMGAMGDAMGRQAGGENAMATRDSTQQATNAGNMAKAFEMAARQIEMSAAASPMMGQAEYGRFLEMVPGPYKGLFPREYSPQVPQMLMSLSQRLTQTPAHRRDMELADKQVVSQQGIATGNNMTQLEIARLKMKQMEEMIEARWGMKSGSIKKVEEVIARYLTKKMDGHQTTPQEDATFQAAQQIQMNFRAAAAGIDPWDARLGFLGGNAPSNPRPTPTPVPPPGGNDNAIRAQVEALGEKYDPQTYEYQMNNGKLQKRKRVR